MRKFSAYSGFFGQTNDCQEPIENQNSPSSSEETQQQNEQSAFSQFFNNAEKSTFQPSQNNEDIVISDSENSVNCDSLNIIENEENSDNSRNSTSYGSSVNFDWKKRKSQQNMSELVAKMREHDNYLMTIREKLHLSNRQ